MYFSFWEKNFLEEKLDVAILGAGITGISTAISLKEKWPQCKVGVIERDVVSQGASTKNAGFSCFGSVTEICDDINHMGVDKTFHIIKMRYEGLKKLRERIPAQKMDYRHYGGYEIFDKGEYGNSVLEGDVFMVNDLFGERLGLRNVFEVRPNTFFENFGDKLVYN